MLIQSTTGDNDQPGGETGERHMLTLNEIILIQWFRSLSREDQKAVSQALQIARKTPGDPMKVIVECLRSGDPELIAWCFAWVEHMQQRVTPSRLANTANTDQRRHYTLAEIMALEVQS